MGLMRTIPASPGYSELHTFGCRECGSKTLLLCANEVCSLIECLLTHDCPVVALFDPN